MNACPKKTNYFNRNISDEIINNNYICSNCGTNQLIKGKYLYSGYCTIENKQNHFHCSLGLKIFDKISFICANNTCNKMSINTLDGKPYFNVFQLNSHEVEILTLLKDNDKETLHDLLKEYFIALGIKQKSAATLLARKMLMHFAFELGCTDTNKKFIEYVSFIKDDGVLGKKWIPKIDKIRQLGNEENHEDKIASEEELENVRIIMLELINSHFKPDLLK